MTYKPRRRRFLGSGDIHAEFMKGRVLINKANTPSSVTDHGTLTGLDDDDHGAVYANFGAAETITGLWDFDRGANPPFSVGGSSTVVSGLDADKLDGRHAADLAGGGLAWDGSEIDVNAGDGIEIVADAVTADVGNGIILSGGEIVLGTPSTLTAITSNAATASSHTHAITTGAPSSLTPDLSNQEGTSSSLARADHIHNIPAETAVTLEWDTANAEGNNASFARSNHTHAITSTYLPGNTATLLRTSDNDLDGTPSDGELHLGRDFSVSGHTFYVDHSESAVYVNAINPSIPPSIRGALSVAPAVNTQKGLTIQAQEYQADHARLFSLYNYAGQELIIVTNEGDLESGNPGFISGQRGWQISHTGDAEFQNAWIRGELHASVFVADEMHALGGTFVALTPVTVANPKSSSDNVVCAEGSPNTFTLVLNRSYDTGLHYGAVDNVIRIKYWAGNVGNKDSLTIHDTHHLHRADSVTVDPTGNEIRVNDAYHYHKADSVELGSPARGLAIYDIFLLVISITDNDDRNLFENNPGTADYVVEYHNNTPDGWPDAEGITIPAGTSGVIWGDTGGATDEFTGGLLFTSDLNYAPYIDVFTVNSDGSPEPWDLANAVKSRVRVGNLDGVLGLSEQWGIAASTDLASSTNPHVILSNTQLTLKGVHQYWWDNSGNLRGEVDPDATGTDSLFWLGESGSDKRLDFRADYSLILDSTNLKIKDGSGNEAFAVCANSFSWGGYTLAQGDVVIGDPAQGHMFYNESAGTISWKSSTANTHVYMNTSGQLIAGDGALILDELGISLKAGTDLSNRFAFLDSGLNEMGGLNALYDAGDNYINLVVALPDSASDLSRLQLQALSTVSSATITVRGAVTGGDSYILLGANYTEVDGYLYVHPGADGIAAAFYGANDPGTRTTIRTHDATGLEGGFIYVYDENDFTYESLYLGYSDTTQGVVVGKPSTVDQYLMVKGGEAGDAILYFYSDQGDDNQDRWRIVNYDTSYSLIFENYYGGGGSYGTSAFLIGYTGNIYAAGCLRVNGAAEVGELTINDADSATSTNIYYTAANNAIVVSTNWSSGTYYQPGLVWQTTGNNSTKTKAIITAAMVTGAGSYIILGASTAYATGANFFVSLGYDGSRRVFGPNTDLTHDLGTNAVSWDEGYADNWNNISDFFWLDERSDENGNTIEVDDLEILRNIKPSNNFDKKTGLRIIDDDSLPKWVFANVYDDNQEIIRPALTSDGRPWMSNRMITSLSWGAIRQLADRVDDLERRLSRYEEV